jgi:adenylate cyclase
MDKKDFAVLFVDDEQHNLTAFNATFRREYKIFTALSGQEGIEIVKNNNIHLIITDQRMPEMTGIQFLEKIVPEYPDIIRMILTGFSDVEAIIKAINTGRVFRYITKPWDENDLRMTIENTRQLSNLQIKNKALVKDLQQKVEYQEKTLKLFIKYVPEPVVEKALSSSEETIFEGELIDVAVLFCDMRDFTPISEEFSPREVVSFLNDYYSIMTECINEHNGTVNQYVGDEIFAVFGAPVATVNNEKNAVFCAIDMIEKLKELNNKYKELFNREIVVGIGVNAGEVIAGNLGSEAKIEFSITGDTVNTGKRIEMIAKDYGNAVLISEPVYQKTKGFIKTAELKPINVKGKKSKIMIHQVQLNS